jgi:chemotaxis protein histidine kinase CheA
VHSLKASSSFKGYGNCCRLMETQEQVLEKLRKNEMEFTPEPPHRPRAGPAPTSAAAE